ncbi:MAG: Ribosomal RNA large subunit methyltransferase I [Chroococcopsis gigantea SAG 12.99]|jgi:23S rRNA (cytosine1962-C5)-methyltransferase|nr:class I SAM-dependent rRNA methyltransferase [Chlorogloea purpurea SAG 13.99]MDV3002304.1 Ribosomal RNA large subunit methyltransferase I [Chroococcopsis gigantea SAG 12.99]
MTQFPKIYIRRNKIDPVKRFHPWIFSGAIKSQEEGIKEGDTVEVYNETGEYLALGHYNANNIAVKLLAYEKVTDIESLFLNKFQQAYDLRTRLGLTQCAHTNCYRLINAEGDGLPGLIVDWYNGTAVIQVHSLGMYHQKETIVHCLQGVYGDRLLAVYDKSAGVMPKMGQNQYLLGEKSDNTVLENGHSFLIDWETGQKTGFFIDQRDNRALLSKYAHNKRVLNTFAYSGGFSVYAGAAGALRVDSVDSSASAIDLSKENIALNDQKDTAHSFYTEDVFEFLTHCAADYNLIILDPPAFAKNISARHSAVMAYKRINYQAIKKIEAGGMIFTFSCSQVVNIDLFRGAVMAAAIEARRPVRILAQLGQGPDHPASIYHPEGHYLKGLVLSVD